MDDSSVRVAVRIRPQIPREQIDMCRVCTSVTPDEPQVWMGSDKAFTYDYVYDMDSTQDAIYDTTVKDLVEGCFEGYNATVFAYGQTGSGKTYTMGTGFDVEVLEETLGIIPRAVHHLFEGIRTRQEEARQNGIPAPDFKVNAQFMELYNEEIIDLLDQTRDPYITRGRRTAVKIHEDSSGGIYTVGVVTRSIVNEDEALGCLRMGALSRTTASTQMNVQSSRSHAIFTLHIKQQRLAKSEIEGDDLGPSEFETLTAKFHFVDLAGSERLKRTGATGERAKEGICINCGLLALGNVISALGDTTKKVTHVPYRDSKLTRLLQDSLGGNSRTLMIACVSPSDRDFMETLNTLKYANRARNIKNRVTVNQDKNSKTIAFLRQEIQQLQLELMEYRQGKRVVNADGTETINDMYHENTMLRSESHNMRMRIKALQETIESLKASNLQLQSEREAGKWITGDGTDSDMSEMVNGYLKEIEDLRTKLLESEAFCQQLKKSNTSIAHRSSYAGSQVAMTGHYDIRIEDSSSNLDSLIQEAKENLEKEQKYVNSRKKSLSENEEKEEKEDEKRNGEEEYGEDEESSDSENKENENIEGELAELQSDINIKQKLIEELELSQRRIQTMRKQYEEKLMQLQQKIKATQVERDKVLQNMTTSSKGSNEMVQKVKTEYESKLTVMQKDLKKLQAAKKEHTKLLKEQGKYEKQLKTLRSDLTELKKTKVKLMNKMKEESVRHKEVEMKRNKEITQLRKEQRKQETAISKLQAEKRLKDGVLKRKQEEIQSLRKSAKPPLSEKASGRFHRRERKPGNKLGVSPKLGKQRWQTLEKSIDKVVLSKQAVADLEQDMDRFLKEREDVRHQLERTTKKRDKEIINGRDERLIQEYEDEIENLKAHMDYVNDNIEDCQTSITQIDSEETFPGLEIGNLLVGMRPQEVDYLVQKIINMSISQSYMTAQKEAQIRDLELRAKQMTKDFEIQQELLRHVLSEYTGDMNIMKLGISPEDQQSSGSSESSRATSPADSLFDPSNPMTWSVYGVESLNNLGKTSKKARRKTATTEELLYASTNGNVEQISLAPPFSPLKEQDEILSNNNSSSYRAVLPKHPSMNIMSK